MQPRQLLPVLFASTVLSGQGAPELATLPGLVRDAGGKPIAGATVRAIDLLDAPQMQVRFARRNIEPLATTATDATGKFILRGIPAAGVMVEIEKPGYYIHTVPYAPAKTAIVTTLEKSGFVSGRVVDAKDRPVEAQLTFYFEGHWFEEMQPTDPTGRFQVNLGYRGKYALRARALPGKATPQIRQLLQPGTFEGPKKDMLLQFGGTVDALGAIRLTVQDETGAPIAKFRAATNWIANRKINDAMIGRMLVSQGIDSDADGTLTLPGPTARQSQTGHVLVHAHGFLPKVVGVEFGAGDGDQAKDEKPAKNIVAKLARAGSVIGKVVDDRTGKPLQGATVQAIPDDPTIRVTLGTPAETAADGSFRIDDLDAKTYSISVLRHGAVAHTQKIAAKLAARVDAGTLRVRLLDVKGQLTGLPTGTQVALPQLPQRRAGGVGLALAVPAVRPVAVMTSVNRLNLRVQNQLESVDAEGRFLFAGVAPGQYQLVASLPQPVGPPIDVPIDTFEASDKDVSLALGSGLAKLGRISGKVQFTRAAVPQGRLLIFAEQEQRNGMRRRLQNRPGPRAIAAADGSFSMLVNPGDYYLTAIDMATGVVVHETEGTMNVGANKTVTPNVNIVLGFVRVSIEPEAGPMPVLSHIEILVNSGNGQNPNGALTAAGINAGGFSGLPLTPGATSLALLLPTKECTLRAYDGRLWMASGRGKAGINHRGEVEFTPTLNEMLKVELKIRKD